jgi:hypothetical protein
VAAGSVAELAPSDQCDDGATGEDHEADTGRAEGHDDYFEVYFEHEPAG